MPFKNLKNTISSVPVAILMLLIVVLGILVFKAIDLPHLNIIRYVFLCVIMCWSFVFIIIYIMKERDDIAEQKCKNRNKELNELVSNLRRETQRLYELQSNKLQKFKEWEDTMGTMGSNYNNTKNETQIE